MRDFIKIASVILMCFILTSCASWFSFGDKPKSLSVNLSASKNINHNIINVTSPIAITVYQLTEDTDFNKLTYQQISDKKITGLLASKTYIIWPGKKLHLNLMLHKQVKQLGFVADYRLLGNKQWRLLQKLGWLTFSANIYIDRNGMQEN